MTRNYRAEANSTRIIESINRRERNNPAPPRHPDQSSHSSAVGGSLWFKNTTFNFPGSQPVRTASKFDPFRAPDYQRISERVVKIAKRMTDRNIRFSGQIKGGGEEYLWLLTEAIKQYGLTEDETFQVIPFSLVMPALGWFMAEKHNMRDYSDFIELFRKKFSSSDSQAKLWEEIQARTQGTGESISEYLTNIQAMFMHLDLDVPMHQQMEIIFKNLHPKFIMHIDPRSIHDYNDFVEQGEMVENKLRCIAQYVPPPSPEKSMLSSAAWSRNGGCKTWRMFATEVKDEVNATDAAPRKNSPILIKNSQNKPKQTKTLATQTEPIPTPITPLENVGICFNCGQPGHFNRACPLPRSFRAQPNMTDDAVNYNPHANYKPNRNFHPNINYNPNVNYNPSRNYNNNRSYNPDNYNNSTITPTENRNQGNWHRGQ